MSSILDFNEYGGFSSGGAATGSFGSGVSTPMTSPTTSKGSWYDGLADTFGSVLDTAVKIGAPILAANATAKANASLVKAQNRALESQARAATPAPSTVTLGNTGLPMWAVYAGAAVVGVAVLFAVVNSARRS